MLSKNQNAKWHAACWTHYIAAAAADADADAVGGVSCSCATVADGVGF
jgi:hypothetical protein